jgi:hypothetical protein
MDFEVDVIVDIGSEEFYRAVRYQTPLSVILLNSKDKDIFSLIEKNTRPTDIIQQISSALIVIFLPHTSKEHACTFMKNIEEFAKFTCVVGEYKGFKTEFVQNLFIENEKKLI